MRVRVTPPTDCPSPDTLLTGCCVLSRFPQVRSSRVESSQVKSSQNGSSRVEPSRFESSRVKPSLTLDGLRCVDPPCCWPGLLAREWSEAIEVTEVAEATEFIEVAEATEFIEVTEALLLMRRSIAGVGGSLARARRSIRSLSLAVWMRARSCSQSWMK